MPQNLLTRRLENYLQLSPQEREVLCSLSVNSQSVDRNRYIVRENDPAASVHLIVDGWAFREKILSDGRRQILAFLLPGDLTDVLFRDLGTMDHGIVTLTPCTVAHIPLHDIEYLVRRRSFFSQALRLTALIDTAILRAWVVGLGRRNAKARVAHLFCELHARLELVGLAEGDRFDFPATQVHLGDALGLTAVHINRTLRELRDEGLVEIRHQQLSIRDLPELRRIADFNPTYLDMAPR